MRLPVVSLSTTCWRIENMDSSANTTHPHRRTPAMPEPPEPEVGPARVVTTAVRDQPSLRTRRRQPARKQRAFTEAPDEPADDSPRPGALPLNEEEFLDLAAHELRAPLTILKGQAQLLQRRLRREAQENAHADREDELGALDKMLYQIERLNHQVNIILEATHLSQGRLEIMPMRHNLAYLLRRTVALCEMGAPTHTILSTLPAADSADFMGMYD